MAPGDSRVVHNDVRCGFAADRQPVTGQCPCT
jgi:hypothetical protein